LLVYLKEFDEQEGKEVIFVNNEAREVEGRSINLLIVPVTFADAHKFKNLWLDKQLYIGHHADKSWKVFTSETQYTHTSSVLAAQSSGGTAYRYRMISQLLERKMLVLTSCKTMDMMLLPKKQHKGIQKWYVVRRWESLFVSKDFDDVHPDVMNENDTRHPFSSNFILETRSPVEASSPSTSSSSQKPRRAAESVPKSRKIPDLSQHAILKDLSAGGATGTRPSASAKPMPSSGTRPVTIGRREMSCGGGGGGRRYPDLPATLRESALRCSRCKRTYGYVFAVLIVMTTTVLSNV
jgi:hypothetical protein